MLVLFSFIQQNNFKPNKHNFKAFYLTIIDHAFVRLFCIAKYEPVIFT